MIAEINLGTHSDLHRQSRRSLCLGRFLSISITLYHFPSSSLVTTCPFLRLSVTPPIDLSSISDHAVSIENRRTANWQANAHMLIGACADKLRYCGTSTYISSIASLLSHSTLCDFKYVLRIVAGGHRTDQESRPKPDPETPAQLHLYTLHLPHQHDDLRIGYNIRHRRHGLYGRVVLRQRLYNTEWTEHGGYQSATHRAAVCPVLVGDAM